MFVFTAFFVTMLNGIDLNFIISYDEFVKIVSFWVYIWVRNEVEIHA